MRLVASFCDIIWMRSDPLCRLSIVCFVKFSRLRLTQFVLSCLIVTDFSIESKFRLININVQCSLEWDDHWQKFIWIWVIFDTEQNLKHDHRQVLTDIWWQDEINKHWNLKFHPASHINSTRNLLSFKIISSSHSWRFWRFFNMCSSVVDSASQTDGRRVTISFRSFC